MLNYLSGRGSWFLFTPEGDRRGDMMMVTLVFESSKKIDEQPLVSSKKRCSAVVRFIRLKGRFFSRGQLRLFCSNTQKPNKPLF